MTVHILTEKDPMQTETDVFLAAAIKHLPDCKFVNLLDGDTVYSITKRYLMTWDDPPKDSRVFTIPNEFHDYSWSIDELGCVEKQDPISDEDRLRGLNGRPPLVLINMPLTLSAVTRIYPQSTIVGYFSTPNEIPRLQQAFGLENLLFLGPRPEEQKDTTKFGYSVLNWVDLQGALTTDVVDPLLSQYWRRGVLQMKGDSVGCGFCGVIRKYAFIQAEILGLESQDDLEKKLPEGRLKFLFANEPLVDRVKSLNEFPILGRIGSICADEEGIVPLTFKRAGKAITCVEESEITQPAFKTFQQTFKDLYGKYDVKFPYEPREK